MNPSAYNEYVAKLEELARTNPASLRSRVSLLLVMGYVYVLLILGAVVAAAIGIAWLLLTTRTAAALLFKITIPLLLLAVTIVKALWVKTVLPEGSPFPLDKAPALRIRIEEIRAALDAPRAGTVMLTSDFNAFVAQIPRLGIFGWPKTYLSLGVPLMFAMEKQQFDAVLAHEFAHLSSSHPKMGLWVYRMSNTWNQLLSHLQASRSIGSRLFERFVEWYEPRLRAYGFVMSRRDEYEADADAARITSNDAMASALMALEVRQRTVSESFWPGVWAQAMTNPEPPEHTWTILPALFRNERSLPEQSAWLSRALTRRALDDDTHPSLAQRLDALGIPTRVAQTEDANEAIIEPLRQSAAEFYLGAHAPVMLAELEREWRESVTDTWKARHEYLQRITTSVAELRTRDAGDDPLDVESTFELASAVMELDGYEAALPYYRRVLALEPNHAVANFVIGRELLGAGDEAGVDHLRRAMATDFDGTAICTELLRQYYAEHGDSLAIEKVQEEQYEYAQLRRAAALERNDVTKHDTLVPADLSEVDLASLRELGANTKGVSALWVARKVTTLLPERAMLVCIVEQPFWRAGWLPKPQELAEAVMQGIRLSFAADLLVLTKARDTTWLYRRIRKIGGACVYSKREK